MALESRGHSSYLSLENQWPVSNHTGHAGCLGRRRLCALRTDRGTLAGYLDNSVCVRPPDAAGGHHVRSVATGSTTRQTWHRQDKRTSGYLCAFRLKILSAGAGPWFNQIDIWSS